jgi:Uma2 family endonuclease
LPLDGEPTWDVAYLFPAQGTWTENDYLRLDAIHDGGPLVELSNGRLEVLPMPTQTHQLIAAFLFGMLYAFTEIHAPGVVLFSGMKVRLQKGARARFRDPDILYMKAEHARRRQEKFWDGADLVMEVVSPDPKDRERDLEIKPREYARAGISRGSFCRTASPLHEKNAPGSRELRSTPGVGRMKLTNLRRNRETNNSAAATVPASALPGHELRSSLHLESGFS